ncbi:hypothetical protein CVV43_04820 [Candidatus Saccharibacteria bacterium HGW-Saccharibacteria-1]|nr:MAG: hypothetical protein CVV43_04820 [Candidatus Saccharibacteria bacterium HGW-Saccharibacteria-1]
MTTSKIFKIVSGIINILKRLSRKSKFFTPSLIESSQLLIQPKFNGGMKKMTKGEMQKTGAGPGYWL